VPEALKVLHRPRRESVIGRGEASDLAPRDPKRAFEIARRIPDGWYRAQAMATIADQARDPILVDKAFVEARAAAAAGDDEYQRAAVLAYVMLTALKLNRRALAEVLLADALALVPKVTPMASRAYALSFLWSVSVAQGDSAMRKAVLAAVQAHVHPDRSWRAKRLYRDIVATIAWDDPRRAEAIIRAMPGGKARAFIARRRAEGERVMPRRS